MKSRTPLSDEEREIIIKLYPRYGERGTCIECAKNGITTTMRRVQYVVEKYSVNIDPRYAQERRRLQALEISTSLKKYFENNPNPMKGKHLSRETKTKISDALAGRSWSDETRKKMMALRSDGIHYLQKRGNSQQTRIRIGSTFKKHFKEDPSFRKRISSERSARMKVLWNDPNNDYRQRNSNANKRKWEDPEYRERQIAKILSGLFKRPTSLEKQFIGFCSIHNLPFKYTGDGSVIIGGANPDFIDVNGKKICIEVANTFHHSQDYEKRRSAHFAVYGWKCIVFRCNKLDESTMRRVLGSVGYDFSNTTGIKGEQ